MKVWRDSNRSPNSAFRMITLLGVISYIIHGDHILIPSILYNIILLLFECSYSLVYYITVSSVFVVVVVCCWRGSPRIWSCVMARFMKLSWRWLAAGSTTLSLSLRVWCHHPPFPSSFYFFFFFFFYQLPFSSSSSSFHVCRSPPPSLDSSILFTGGVGGGRRRRRVGGVESGWVMFHSIPLYTQCLFLPSSLDVHFLIGLPKEEEVDRIFWHWPIHGELIWLSFTTTWWCSMSGGHQLSFLDGGQIIRSR